MSGSHIFNTGGVLAIENISNISFIGSWSMMQYSVENKVNEYSFNVIFDEDKAITFLQSTTNITCINFSGFFFRNISNLNLINITIVNCGADIHQMLTSVYRNSTLVPGISYIQYAALLMINISNLLLKGTSVQNSTGYGLVGIRVMGHSQILSSSFVGNNQFVKSSLQVYSKNITSLCSGWSSNMNTYYVNNAPKEDTQYKGGNMLLIYDESDYYSSQNILIIDSCLFTLGIDGSIAVGSEQNLSLMDGYAPKGTGLSVFMTQTLYDVLTTITNTVAYRNQAFTGANFYFQNCLRCSVTASNVHSIKGISPLGYGFYYQDEPSLYADIGNSNYLSFINSTFSTDYYNSGASLFINVSSQNEIVFENCTLIGNVTVYSRTVSNLNSSVLLYNSIINNASCGDIDHIEFSMNTSVFNCTFNGKWINSYGNYFQFRSSNFLQSAISMSNSYAVIINSTFLNSLSSAALYISTSHAKVSNSTFLNSMFTAIFINSSLYTEVSSCILINNKFNALLIYNSFARISNCRFSKNLPIAISIYTSSAVISDTMFESSQSTAIAIFSSDIIVADSTFLNRLSTAVKLVSSSITLTGNVSFYNNTSTNGGALNLLFSSFILSAPANIKFINNSALYRGGAIFVVPNPIPDVSTNRLNAIQCFIKINDPNGTADNPGVKLYLNGNSASFAGNVLYGGDIDTCTLNCSLSPYLCTRLPITIFGNTGNSLAVISSDPRGVCGCLNDVPDCNSDLTSIDPVYVYPGQILNISIVTVGQFNGLSPDVVLSYTCRIDDPKFSLSNITNCSVPAFNNQLQQTQPYCTNYSYPVIVEKEQSYKSVLFLLPRTPYFAGNSYTNYFVKLSIQLCPFGFPWSQALQQCSCSPGVRCDINTLTIFRTGTQWIGNSSRNVLAMHGNCPSNLCTSADMGFSIATQDDQCVSGHQGVLCAGCKYNLSAVFGSTKCMACSNQYVWVLIPITIMGVALVMFLFLLNCTVSEGTLNGLILWANLLRPSVLNLLPDINSSQALLFVFVNWLNLDLGVEVCFYNGMDTYAKTWLQLVFPLYLVVLVGMIIIGNRWSSRLARLCRGNAVSVMATLILLSYTKALQTVITIFLYTRLNIGNATVDNPPVWLADANVLYLQGKHIPLFMAGMILTTVFITPYTLLLLLSPWLQSKSHWRGLQWINKLKPLNDVYQAPFKDQYHYWPGILLMLRMVLYLVYTSNTDNDVNVNLIATFLAVSSYCIMANMVGVYKLRLLTMLDSFFEINMMVFLFTLILTIRSTNGSYSPILIEISIGSVLLVSFCIFVFQAYQQLKGTKCFKKIINVIPVQRVYNFFSMEPNTPQEGNSVAAVRKDSCIELRESIMN